MKEIQLPIVPGDMELPSALSLLRTHRKAALLVQRDAGYVLYSAGGIASGRGQGSRVLDDLQPDSIPQRVPGGHTPTGIAANVDLPILGGATPGIFRANPRTGRILIQDHVLADIYVAPPKDYYCDSPRHHPFPPPDVAEGDQCPFGDGRIISAK